MSNIVNLSEIEALKAQLAAAQAKIADMAKAQERAIKLKVSEKGALSLYGLGRFPVTLYRGQWERLLAHKSDIEAFIRANDRLLSVKE